MRQSVLTTLPHCYTVTLLLCYTTALLLCYTVDFLNCYFFTLLFSYTVTLPYCYLVTLLLCYIVTLLFCYFVTRPRCTLLLVSIYLDNVIHFAKYACDDWRHGLSHRGCPVGVRVTEYLGKINLQKQQ